MAIMQIVAFRNDGNDEKSRVKDGNRLHVIFHILSFDRN